MLDVCLRTFCQVSTTHTCTHTCTHRCVRTCMHYVFHHAQRDLGAGGWRRGRTRLGCGTRGLGQRHTHHAHTTRTNRSDRFGSSMDSNSRKGVGLSPQVTVPARTSSTWLVMDWRRNIGELWSKPLYSIYVSSCPPPD